MTISQAFDVRTWSLYLNILKGSSDSGLVDQRKEWLLICEKCFIDVFACLLYLFYIGLNREDNGKKNPLISSLPIKQKTSL